MNRLSIFFVLAFAVCAPACNLDKTVDKWGDGQVFQFSYPITSNTQWNNLVLTFDKNVTPSKNAGDIWNVQYGSTSGKQVTVKPNGNNNLWNGNDFEFGFIMSYNNGANPKLTSAKLDGKELCSGSSSGDSSGGSSGGSTGGSDFEGAEQYSGNGCGKESNDKGFNKCSKGKYDYNEALHKSFLFYEAQRSGDLPPTNRIPWRCDSTMKDGKPNGVDLTGGYFDAGDFIKVGFPLASTLTQVAWGMNTWTPAVKSAGEQNYAYDMLKWGTDWIIKAHTKPNTLWGQVADGYEDHGYWGRAEDLDSQGHSRPSFKIDQNNPGSDLAGESAAALAASAMYYKKIGKTADATNALKHAEELFNFADKYRGKFSDAISSQSEFYASWSGFNDELVWAACWLYKATGKNTYKTKAISFYNQFSNVQKTPGEFSWDNKVMGAQVCLHDITGNYKSKIKDIVKVLKGLKKTGKGHVFIQPWGSLRHAMNVAHIALQAAELNNVDNADKTWLRNFATAQLNLVLGDTGRSFVVGYGTNPPKNPHHRNSSCKGRNDCLKSSSANPPNPNTLYGALVGGPENEWDSFKDDRTNYITSEVAIDYNAGFTSVLAGVSSLKC